MVDKMALPQVGTTDLRKADLMVEMMAFLLVVAMGLMKVAMKAAPKECSLVVLTDTLTVGELEWAKAR